MARPHPNFESPSPFFFHHEAIHWLKHLQPCLGRQLLGFSHKRRSHFIFYSFIDFLVRLPADSCSTTPKHYQVRVRKTFTKQPKSCNKNQTRFFFSFCRSSFFFVFYLRVCSPAFGAWVSVWFLAYIKIHQSYLNSFG